MESFGETHTGAGCLGPLPRLPDSVASTILDGASMQTEKKIPSPHQPHPLYHRGPFQPLRLLESFLIAVAIQKPASPTQAP